MQYAAEAIKDFVIKVKAGSNCVMVHVGKTRTEVEVMREILSAVREWLETALKRAVENGKAWATELYKMEDLRTSWTT